MYQRSAAWLVLGLLLACAGCTTFDTEREDVVTFVFSHPATECDVFLGNAQIGRVSIAKAAIGVARSAEPLRISCGTSGHAPVSAEISAARTRDQSYGVLGVNVPTPRALSARVVEPITGPPQTGYPPRVTVDIAQRKVVVPDGWQVRM